MDFEPKIEPRKIGLRNPRIEIMVIDLESLGIENPRVWYEPESVCLLWGSDSQ